MADCPNPEIARISGGLRGGRPSAAGSRIAEIERYRSQLSSRGAADHHAMSPTRLQALAGIASKSPRWAALIFDLVVALRPAHVLEMGTAVGISGAYIASGYESNGLGELVTIDADLAACEVARQTFRDLRLDHRTTVVHGTFAETVDFVVDGNPPFDLVFKDGDHAQSATTDWFDHLAPRLAPTSAFLLDDIRRDRGMRQAWNQIRTRDQVAASVDFFGMGLVLLSRGTKTPAAHFRYGVR